MGTGVSKETRASLSLLYTKSVEACVFEEHKQHLRAVVGGRAAGGQELFTVNKSWSCWRVPEKVWGKEWGTFQCQIHWDLKPGSLLHCSFNMNDLSIKAISISMSTTFTTNINYPGILASPLVRDLTRSQEKRLLSLVPPNFSVFLSFLCQTTHPRSPTRGTVAGGMQGEGVDVN